MSAPRQNAPADRRRRAGRRPRTPRASWALLALALAQVGCDALVAGLENLLLSFVVLCLALTLWGLLEATALVLLALCCSRRPLSPAVHRLSLAVAAVGGAVGLAALGYGTHPDALQAAGRVKGLFYLGLDGAPRALVAVGIASLAVAVANIVGAERASRRVVPRGSSPRGAP